MSKAFLGDQLGRDEGLDGEVDFAPVGEEPLINCWIEVTCDTPDGEEKINYMFVDGAYVRDHLFVDFCEGGHFYRYGWTPEGQIWIEDEMNIVDRLCTGVHEIHERFKMKYLGWTYDRAHDSACVIERKIRALCLGDEIIIPHTEDIGKIFALEGSGKDSARLAEGLFSSHTNLVDEANKQANNAGGTRNG